MLGQCLLSKQEEYGFWNRIHLKLTFPALNQDRKSTDFLLPAPAYFLSLLADPNLTPTSVTLSTLVLTDQLGRISNCGGCGGPVLKGSNLRDQSGLILLRRPLCIALVSVLTLEYLFLIITLKFGRTSLLRYLLVFFSLFSRCLPIVFGNWGSSFGASFCRWLACSISNLHMLPSEHAPGDILFQSTYKQPDPFHYRSPRSDNYFIKPSWLSDKLSPESCKFS